MLADAVMSFNSLLSFFNCDFEYYVNVVYLYISVEGSFCRDSKLPRNSLAVWDLAWFRMLTISQSKLGLSLFHVL